MCAADVPPSSVAFNVAIAAAQRAPNPSCCINAPPAVSHATPPLLKAMCAADVPPSSVAFNVAIAAAQRAPDRVKSAELVIAIYTLETLR